MWRNLDHGRYISWKRKNPNGLSERQFLKMRAAVMARSGNLKWCLLIVAFIALFAYHRSNRQTDWQGRLGESQGVDETSDLQLEVNDVYTGVPARDESMPVESIEDGIAAQVENALQFATDRTDGAMEMVDEVPMDFNALEQEIPFGDFSEATEQASEPAFEETTSILGNANGGMVNEFAQQPDSLDHLRSEMVQSTTLETLPSKLPKPQHNFVPAPPRQRQTPARAIMPAKPFRLPDGVQIKVVQHIEYGKSLARRGATFGAQKEFQSALRLVAQAIDYKNNSRELTSRLSSAFLALREADDFYFAQSEHEGIVDVLTIGKRHDSDILTEEMLSQMTPVDAMQAYYNYVQDQFIVCGGKTVVAGEALYCLGKLFVVKSKSVVDGSQLDNAKAIVHHRSAIGCDSRNYKSANELAVLLAKAGRMKQAKNLLVHSLKVKQIPRAWENLAFIHQQLGEAKLAELAFTEFQRTLEAPPATNQIQWIAPDQFARQSQQQSSLRTAQAIPVPQAPAVDKNQKSTSLKNVLKKMF